MMPILGDNIIVIDFNGINDLPIYRETTVIWVEGQKLYIDHPIVDIMGDTCNIFSEEDYQIGWFTLDEKLPKMNDLVEKIANIE